jgi:inner membrane protein
MATPITHGLFALAAGKVAFARKMPARFWVLTALVSVLPDVDTLAFRFGIRYQNVLGHRGLTHSLLFAAVMAGAVMALAFRDVRTFSGFWWALAAFFFGVGASHGLLDAMTDGGLGVAFFAPFSDARYFLPFQPLRVSPIGVSRFLTRRGVDVMLSEMLWVWLPALVAVAATLTCRKIIFRRQSGPGIK